jgi:antitoxin MazE
MTVVVRKWGNSAAVRIPDRVLAEAGPDIDHPIDISEDRGRIIIEPVREKQFALEYLLNRIRQGNLHEPVDTGDPVGREAGEACGPDQESGLAARRATRSGRVSDAVLSEVRAKIRALIGA